MALTKDRNTAKRAGQDFSAPAAAGVVAYAGALIALDAAGNATPGATATTLKAGGRCSEHVDNTGGSAGDVQIPYEKGVFDWNNSAGADEITQAEVETTCYIVDDQTVAKTDGGGTRSVAGVVKGITPNGRIWVDMT